MKARCRTETNWTDWKIIKITTLGLASKSSTPLIFRHWIEESHQTLEWKMISQCHVFKFSQLNLSWTSGKETKNSFAELQLFAIQCCCCSMKSQFPPETFCNPVKSNFQGFLRFFPENTALSSDSFAAWSILNDTAHPSLVLVVTALWMWNWIWNSTWMVCGFGGWREGIAVDGW